MDVCVMMSQERSRPKLPVLTETQIGRLGMFLACFMSAGPSLSHVMQPAGRAGRSHPNYLPQNNGIDRRGRDEGRGRLFLTAAWCAAPQGCEGPQIHFPDTDPWWVKGWKCLSGLSCGAGTFRFSEQILKGGKSPKVGSRCLAVDQVARYETESRASTAIAEYSLGRLWQPKPLRSESFARLPLISHQVPDPCSP